LENIYKSNQEALIPDLWAENSLYSIKTDELFTSYMAHYRGWTILISQDSTEQYWNALAINNLYYNYSTFIQAAHNADLTKFSGYDNLFLTTLGRWWPTKEETYLGIKFKIDKILEQS
jgi:hypothetical protein